MKWKFPSLEMKTFFVVRSLSFRTPFPRSALQCSYINRKLLRTLEKVLIRISCLEIEIEKKMPIYFGRAIDIFLNDYLELVSSTA